MTVSSHFSLQLNMLNPVGDYDSRALANIRFSIKNDLERPLGNMSRSESSPTNAESQRFTGLIHEWETEIVRIIQSQ